MFPRIPYTQEASPLFFEAPNYQTTMHRTRNPSPLLYSSENVKEIISGGRVFFYFSLFRTFRYLFQSAENYFLTKRYSEYVYKSIIPNKIQYFSLYIFAPLLHSVYICFPLVYHGRSEGVRVSYYRKIEVGTDQWVGILLEK